jgi:outer membrane protein OmpA-like peptidoglycan-associated protein
MSRKIPLFPVFFIILASFCYSQEQGTISAGALFEANANTRHGFGLAAGLMGDYGITDRIAAGLKLDVGSDLYDIISGEVMAFGRYYFLPKSLPPLYAQLGAGGIMLRELGKDNYEEKTRFSVLVDGSLGVRFPIYGNFYTEQYIRFGWPSGFGLGLVVGYKFNSKKVPDEPVRTVEVPGQDVYQVMEEVLIIPEIIFPANVAVFTTKAQDPVRGLDEATIERNHEAIATIADFMKRHGDYNLFVEGYANPIVGTTLENAEQLIPLSRRRAEYIKQELIELGVEEWRITAIAAGGLGADKNNVWHNRRVQFHLERTAGVP